MPKTAQPIEVDARTELRDWYLGRLRPRLENAVAVGTVEPAAVEALDDQLGELFGEPDEPSPEPV
jgi:hypothetical protein